MIEVRHVSKRFRSTTRGALTAVHDMSLRIADGELVCLVGPSGCGKTTLLNLIAGLEAPDAGELLVAGQAVRGPGPDRGVLFQEAALFPWLDVRENVAFGLKAMRLPRHERDARVQRHLELVKMSRFARSYVHELSGGMRQRVALARALALEPAILLMDEPFGALDPKSRDELQAQLIDIWRATGKTIVFVTHDMAEAVRLGSRVIVLKARPARVALEVDVASLLPQPRQVDSRALAALAAHLKQTLDDTDDAGEVLHDHDDAHREPLAGPAGADAAAAGLELPR